MKVLFEIPDIGPVTAGSTITIASVAGAGKTSMACYIVSLALKQNKNVLYITSEMREGHILSRINYYRETDSGDGRIWMNLSYEARTAMEWIDKYMEDNEKPDIVIVDDLSQYYLGLDYTYSPPREVLCEYEGHQTEHEKIAASGRFRGPKNGCIEALTGYFMLRDIVFVGVVSMRKTVAGQQLDIQSKLMYQSDMVLAASERPGLHDHFLKFKCLKNRNNPEGEIQIPVYDRIRPLSMRQTNY